MLLAGIPTFAKGHPWADTLMYPATADPPHDGTDITRQVPTAGSRGEILLGVQPVSVNHEVSIGQVA